MEDIAKVYDPANAGNLTEEQIAAIEHLTPDEISTLAKAFPNGPQGNTYLVLKDKTLPADKQLNSVSTWQNLADLHRIGQKQFVAAGFSANFKKPQPVKQAPVQDLTKEDAQNELRNVTTAAPQNASFAKDTNDSLVNTEGQGATGATTKPLQGGDIAGQSQTLSDEEKAKITSGTNKVEGMTGDETGNDDEIPLEEMLKPGLQEVYQEKFGEAPKAAWKKEELLEAIKSNKPIE